MELTEYSVSSVTEGIEALATTRIVVRPAGKMASEGFVTSHKARLADATYLPWVVSVIST